jgi:asparagine synthase (glutamine-hydrolysing)
VGGAADLAALERMTDAMAQRGPDGRGAWSDRHAALGFRRLAIIDLHERSNQPLHLGPLHLVFNGEIYNYLELRDELRALGHRFETEGDGEVLLHAWRQWGEGALDRFEGMFALALWDDGVRQLTLAVDRFAEKPLFYARRGNGLVFASTVRALRAGELGIGVPDERAVGDFLALGAMPLLPRTFFADVMRLPPAHMARWEGGALRLRRYWSPARVPVPNDPAAVARQLRSMLLDSVKLRLRSDVPVGTSLSGGVDSSAIVGLCARVAEDQSRHAFTATFAGFPRDEWSYASTIASAAGVTHHHAVRPLADELLDDLQTLVRDQEEPFLSTSIYAQWRVMRAAHEAGVTVLLDGQGADELFGGYLGSGGWALRSGGPRAAIMALARNPTIAKDLASSYAIGRAPRALVRRHRLRRSSPYVTRGLADRASAAPPIPSDWPEAGTPLRQELLREAFQTSLPNLCRYADRDSMAHSVEVRMPFLDRRLAEFALSLPARQVFDGGVTKCSLRAALRGVVSDEILDRREKIGYETPQESWLNAPAVRAHMAEIVLDPRARASGRYESTQLEQDLTRGAWRDNGALWRAVSVELWLSECAAPAHLNRRVA